MNSYDPYEPTYDEDEPFSPHDPDDVENISAQTPAPGTTEDSDTLTPATNGAGGSIVEINGGGGDMNQQQAGKRNAVFGLKATKISENERSTTPYMTKYERARVLGTRALQIRCIMFPCSDVEEFEEIILESTMKTSIRLLLMNASSLCCQKDCRYRYGPNEC